MFYIVYKPVTILISFNSMHVLGDEWFKLQRYGTLKRGLPCLFATVPGTVPCTLRTKRLEAVQKQVIDIGEESSVVGMGVVISV